MVSLVAQPGRLRWSPRVPVEMRWSAGRARGCGRGSGIRLSDRSNLHRIPNGEAIAMAASYQREHHPGIALPRIRPEQLLEILNAEPPPRQSRARCVVVAIRGEADAEGLFEVVVLSLVMNENEWTCPARLPRGGAHSYGAALYFFDSPSGCAD